MRHRTLTAALLIGVALQLGAAHAQSDCQQKLAEIDAALAENDQLDENRRQMIEGLRDMAARYCDQGQPAIATRMIDGIQAQLGGASNDDADAKPESLPKEQLTREYLEGWWCALTKRYEPKTPVLFAADGSHRIGQPAGDKYGMYRSGDELKDFHRQFERLISKKPKRFVVVDRHGHETVYERGRCEGIETAL
jgi:hypothetical protein